MCTIPFDTGTVKNTKAGIFVKKDYREEFFDFIKKGSSPFHVIKECEKKLEKAGFSKLNLSDSWSVERGRNYYIVCHDSSLFAFTVGKSYNFHQGLRIVASHVDSPCPRIKTHAEINDEGYQKLNVEMYGGAILNTWLDRPLSIAGRVAVRSDDVFKPQMKFVDFKNPVVTIPNVAIHINRDLNKGVELNKQTDMLPVAGMDIKKEHKEFLLDALAKKLDVKKEDILDYELCVYNTDEPQQLGFNKEFISAPRLDNLVSTYAAVEGIISNERKSGINMIALFDHEEIGSRTKQGAASQLLSHIIEKICLCYGQDNMQFVETVADSMMLSLDVSHGLHPNKIEKYDLTNKPVLGGGICIKEACSQSYATDSEAIAIVQQICDKEKIAYQKSVNRSDGTGGSTLGAIAGTMLPMQIVDLGIPLLAMHSARELMGQADQDATQKLVDKFFSL